MAERPKSSSSDDGRGSLAMMNSVRFTLLFALGCAASASNAPGPTTHVRETSPQTGQNTPLETPPEVDTWSGMYALQGTTGPDGCGGGVVLAAEHLRVDLDAGHVEADVVNRQYRLSEVDSDHLVAEGRFPVQVCPAATIFERWTLQRTASGFVGTLESTWPRAEQCDQVCSVRFDLVGSASP